MKKINFLKITHHLSLVTCYLLLVTSVHAASPPTPTTTASATTTTSESQINELKDRIASRVAQLKLVERRGIIGTATEVSDTQITINDTQNNTRFIDVDDITKFSSPSAKDSFGISDINKGDTLGILGLYNKESRRLLARFVGLLKLPTFVSGAVSSIDSDNYTITIATADGKKILVDVQTTTKTQTYTQTDGMVRSGFSKITVGERVMTEGTQDPNDKNRIVGSRILLFPNIPANPKINLSAQASPTQTEATTSGKKQ